MTIAVIAGSGALPGLVLDHSDALLVGLDGVAQDTGRELDISARFEQLGGLFESLTSRGVTEVVFAGAMGRPALDQTKFDMETLQMLPRLLPLLNQGDDALLTGIIAEFEAKGFAVRGPHEFVPDLLVGEGVLTASEPSADDLADAARGKAVLTALGALDVGQGCISCAGQVLGVETLYGTDAMLSDVAARRGERLPSVNGVFVKRAKDGQDLRVDLPTIGPDTVAAAVAADLSGICLQAGHVQVLDRDAVVQAADQAGLVIWASA